MRLRSISGCAAILALGALPFLAAPPAAAGPIHASGLAGSERITRYDVGMVLRADGSMQVQETIKYDFGAAERHGILRSIPVAFARDETRDRVYPLSNVQVSSPSGAPDDVEVTDGNVTVIRIGDPDRTVSGTQTYVIGYRVEGVINTFPDHQELYWNAIGDEWPVPIAEARVTVEGPAAIDKVACFRGARGSTQTCSDSITQSGQGRFTARSLDAFGGVTVVASFPVETFTQTEPILRERQTLQRAFSLTPATSVGALAVLAALAGGAAFLVAQRGRDVRYLGVTPGLEPGIEQPSLVAKVPWLRRDPIAVQFTPPTDLRPGQLGTLLDERANVVDVTATIIDLAVRGFLTIEEIEEKGWFRSGDWRLSMVWPAPTAELNDYEMELLKAIFDDRREVTVGELKRTFAEDLSRVQGLLYDDVTSRGWFRGNPASVRTRWQVAGIAACGVGGLLTWLLATRTRFGLVGVAAVIGGLALLALASRMPARTARGTAVLAQAKGFRTYLETAEANQIRFEEGQDVFSSYLPFAIVFGVAERWAQVFAQLAASGAAVAAPTWYVGSGGGPFDYGGFGRSVDSFNTVAAGALAASTPSSSGSSGFGGGGFSGGGGGGGGGGSW